jgi:hypothetical protein
VTGREKVGAPNVELDQSLDKVVERLLVVHKFVTELDHGDPLLAIARDRLANGEAIVGQASRLCEEQVSRSSRVGRDALGYDCL